jgi:hypothetical protein
MFTHNQIISSFKTFSSDHEQLESYGTGPIDEVNEATIQEPIYYPQMWAFLSGAATSENTISYSYDVLFYDLVQPDASNMDEVLSDTILIANDFLIYLNAPENYDKWFFDIGQSIEPFTDRFRDDVTGVKVSITLKTRGAQDNLCIVPMI